MGNNTLKLSQACEGMLRYKAATGKSPHTIVDYRSSFKKLQLYFSSDPPFASITRAQLIAFFAWQQDEYVSEPDGAAPRGKAQLSAKTVFNIHTNLSSLWCCVASAWATSISTPTASRSMARDPDAMGKRELSTVGSEPVRRYGSAYFRG
jgi:hypothetical protein